MMMMMMMKRRRRREEINSLVLQPHISLLYMPWWQMNTAQEQNNWHVKLTQSETNLHQYPRMGEMQPQNTLVQWLKLAIWPLDLPCSGLIIHAGEILTTGKSHKKLDIIFPKDYSQMKKVLQFKYASWNVTGLREKEE